MGMAVLVSRSGLVRVLGKDRLQGRMSYRVLVLGIVLEWVWGTVQGRRSVLELE